VTAYARDMPRTLLAFVVAVGTLAGCGSSEPVATTSPPTTAAPQSTPAPGTSTPKYSVLGKSSRPVDGKAIYFVLIAPVDLSTDGFKRDVKLVLQAVAKTDGGSDFSARILDDEAVASQAFSEETDPRLSQSPDEQREFEERKAQHLVAMYTGGLNTGLGYPYDVSWYPAAASDTPNVGRYVGSEEWRP
jgi:hypothetical protein